MKITGMTYEQLCYLVFDEILIPKIKRNSPKSDLFDEKDVEILLSNKESFRNNLLALEIEKELCGK